MDPQKRETIEKRLIRWLLIATLALVILVLGLQAWHLLRPTVSQGGEPLTQDAGASEPLNTPAGSGPAANISSGKAAMIEDVRARNSDLSFDSLAALSAEELEQLCQTEAPPDRVPVGISRAAELAEKYAGTLEVDSVTWDADPELDETPPHYEVELHHATLGDFEYTVDAYTGEILEGRPNILQSTYVPASGGEAAPATAPAQEAPSENSLPSGGEEAAKAAAFAHAGISPEDAESLRVKSDWEDGVQVYEIEFRANGVEYDYEIEAATGAVRKAGQEWGGGTSGSVSASLIGEEAAKTAALAHAGVSAQDVDFIRWELDRDHGVQVYEIEFTAGGVEYEYEIGAADGTVQKAEHGH